MGLQEIQSVVSVSTFSFPLFPVIVSFAIAFQSTLRRSFWRAEGSTGKIVAAPLSIP
jgi:hypothetical protein